MMMILINTFIMYIFISIFVFFNLFLNENFKFKNNDTKEYIRPSLKWIIILSLAWIIVLPNSIKEDKNE